MNLQSLCQECHLTETLFQCIIIKYCFLKDFLIRKESNLCSSQLRLTFSVNSEFIAYFTTLITLFINLAFVGNLYFQPLRKSINNRCTYSVQSSGYLVPSTAEFTTGMQDCKYNLNCRKSCLMVDSYRNSTPIVCDRYRIVFVNVYLNFITISGQSLIHRIIYNLINQMMKSSDGSAANVHTRSFSYGFQSFQNLNLVRSVFSVKFCT